MKITAISTLLPTAALVLGLGIGGAAGAAELRLNIPADPAKIDPITYSELVAGDVLRNVYEGFTGHRRGGQRGAGAGAERGTPHATTSASPSTASGGEIPLRPALHRKGREIHLRSS